MTTRTRLTALATTAVLATTSGVLVSAPTAVAVGLESPADAPSAPSAPSASARTPKARGANPGWTNPLARPAQPTGLRGSYDGVVNEASLWWAASKETNLAGYRVYRRLDTTEWSQVSGSALLTTPYFVDTPNPTGQTVHYQVRGVSKTGRESEGSLAVSAITADRTAPVAPSGLNISHDFFTATLRWQPVADAAKYEVYAAASAAGPYTLPGTSTGPSYDDHNPPRKTLRYYRVRALDARGNPSAYSAVVTGDGVDPPQRRPGGSRPGHRSEGHAPQRRDAAELVGSRRGRRHLVRRPARRPPARRHDPLARPVHRRGLRRADGTAVVTHSWGCVRPAFV
ncbi:fibronectin type III domain-containing protein [Streptomyces sp. NPDC090036]|uniref:fibronectin type III domain-containing protein n=1 Tax=Streptomyces sp. NPDC090036 TaxID=3365926 RepID=UPI00381CD1B9